MPVYEDQLHREVRMTRVPKRIVSLVPSITELLFDLGLEEEVVGITKFCVHPSTWFRTKTRVGGTKNIKIPVAASLKPDLIIANKEENVKEQVEQLQNISPVWISDVSNLDDALQMIEQIGGITGRSEKAGDIIQSIQTNFRQLVNPSGQTIPRQKTCYLIWKDPYMTIGGDTFIHDMLERCGFENLFADHKRYPEISIDQLATFNCQLLLLSSEPYPFKQKHIAELQILLPSSMMFLVDGEMFSWYGSRLQFAPLYFRELTAKIELLKKML